jgi:hypothetical protein
MIEATDEGKVMSHRLPSHSRPKDEPSGHFGRSQATA